MVSVSVSAPYLSVTKSSFLIRKNASCQTKGLQLISHLLGSGAGFLGVCSGLGQLVWGQMGPGVHPTSLVNPWPSLL